MVNLLCFVVVLFGCCVGVAEPTAFVFNGTLFCHQGWWQYHIGVYELDTGIDDFIGEYKETVMGKNSSSYSIDGVYEHWDGLFDGNLELGYRLFYVCKGAIHHFKIRSQTIPDTQKYFREELEFDLNNARWRVYQRCDKLFCGSHH